MLVREGNRNYCRYFKGKGAELTKFTELAAYRIARRVGAVASRLGFLVKAEWALSLHSGTQATDGNSTTSNVPVLSWQEEGNKDIASTVS